MQLYLEHPAGADVFDVNLVISSEIIWSERTHVSNREKRTENSAEVWLIRKQSSLSYKLQNLITVKGQSHILNKEYLKQSVEEGIIDLVDALHT